MPVKSSPIYLTDIVATGSPTEPVTVECVDQGRKPKPVAYGWVQGEAVQPAMAVNAAEYSVYQDYAVNSTIGVGFYVGVNLGAVQLGTTGPLSWELASNEAVAFGLREPLQTRQTRFRGLQLMRAGIWLEGDWFQAGHLDDLEFSTSQLKKLFEAHLQPFQLRAPPTLVRTARRLVGSMKIGGPLGRLAREAAGLNLLLETLSLLVSNPKLPTAGSGRAVEGIMLVRDLLDRLNPADDIELAKLAHSAGMSVRSMTRHFRIIMGVTISEYVADSRMERARQALAKEGASMDYAAHIAGYGHTPNFATAFRRRYGCTPGSLISTAAKRGLRT